MYKNKKVLTSKLVGSEFLKRLGQEGWTNIKTVVDILHEPILILDEELRVMAANEPFYKTFQVDSKDTEGRVVYELGNGQWNIPALRKLLEDVLPNKTFFKGFEVEHKFAFIGHKIMILNARQIYCKEDASLPHCPPIILLAMEDVTDLMSVAQKLAEHANQFESNIMEETETLKVHIRKLEKEMSELQKRD